MIVYGSSLAPPVRKVLALLREKGLTAEHRPLAPQDMSPDFRKASPFGLIPAFCDADILLSDSTAICQYLDRRYPNPALMPTDARDFGRAVWFDRFSDSFLGVAECKVVNNLIVRKLQAKEPDMDVVRSALNEELPPLFDYLETQIRGQFLVADVITIADLAVASPFASLRAAGYTLDDRRWPRLDIYVKEILGRASMRDIRD